jgi:hypothetical protein
MRSGYRLLLTEQADPSALSNGPHGLLVRGRGAVHQADALGELTIPAPFSLPMRLFAEAKFRKARTGLAAVRNALGLIEDVNQQHSTAHSMSAGLPPQRYLYRYALFSTSGFTADAQAFALAQQISLIDLRGPAFADLRAAVQQAADRLLQAARQARIVRYPTGQTRTALRLALGTWYPGEPPRTFDDAVDAASRATTVMVGTERRLLPPERLATIAAELAEDLDDELILGFPQAPFVLALQPDDPDAVAAFLDAAGPTVDVRIGFARDDDASGDWIIRPDDGPDDVVLRFGVPPMLESWLLAVDDEARSRAVTLKSSLLSTISVFRGDRVTQLTFIPAPRPVVDVRTYAADDSTPLRRAMEIADPPPRERRRRKDDILYESRTVPEAVADVWTEDGVRELMRRLDTQRPVQAAVIRTAVNQDGSASRRIVYELGRYGATRTLRGFTRPINRITAQLQREGLVAEGVAPALRPWYPRPGPAQRFDVAPEIVDIIRSLD